MMELDAQRKEHKERTERRKTNWLYVQQHLAAELVACAKSWCQDTTYGQARAAALRLATNNARSSKMCMHASKAVLDPAWDPSMKVGYIGLASPFDLAAKGRSSAKKDWASERMARAIFDGREAREAKSAEAVYSRLNRLLEEIAPGYGPKLFDGCHLANDLLERYSRNVDVCLVAALQRYCMVVPENVYPCILRDWPWDDDKLDAWVQAHRKAESLARAKLFKPPKEKKFLIKRYAETCAQAEAVVLSIPKGTTEAVVLSVEPSMAVSAPKGKTKTSKDTHKDVSIAKETSEAVVLSVEAGSAPKGKTSLSKETHMPDAESATKRHRREPDEPSTSASSTEAGGSLLYSKWGDVP